MKLKTYLTAGLLTLGAPLAAQAALQFDTQGLGNVIDENYANGDVITIDAFDWTPHSFLAEGGTSAFIAAGVAEASGTDCGTACDFQVYAHGSLGTAQFDGGNVWSGSETGAEAVEITYVLSFTETVVSATIGSPVATFSVKEEAGITLEIYWDVTPDASALTGSGYNDGTLILFGDEILDSTGLFLRTGDTPVDLDQTTDGINDYPDQLTIPGTGSNAIIDIGGLTQDNNFFLDTLTLFGLNMTNVSLSLPYNNVNPADCFNGNANSAAGVGLASTVVGCNDSHIDGTFEDNEGDGNPAGTLVPRTGTVNGFPPGGSYDGEACLSLGDNGLSNACPDFVAQTDSNSGFEVEDVPEPGTLAITGLGLLLLGARRRRNRNRV